jgi:hypothetical protein
MPKTLINNVFHELIYTNEKLIQNTEMKCDICYKWHGEED